MRFVLFDVVLERHLVAGLQRALERRGHEVLATGAVHHGQHPPHFPDQVEAVDRAVELALDFEPDALLNFRPATLLHGHLARLGEHGVHRLAWLPDDPVLYATSYRDVIEDYDTVLHAGFEPILAFYEQRHGPTGVSMPFWADPEDLPLRRDARAADVDLVFLGACAGPVRRARYATIDRLGVPTRIHGAVEDDPARRDGGWLPTTADVAAALARARCGLNLPQRFADYAGSGHDFPGLAELGHFWIPSRAVQYAAVGLPILTVAPPGCPETFPGAITLVDHGGDLSGEARAVLADADTLHACAQACRRSFEQAFTADARAALVEHLVEEPGAWAALDVHDRASLYERMGIREDTLHERAETAKPASRSLKVRVGDGQASGLPDLDAQREGLRKVRPASPRSWRILSFGAHAHGSTDIVASLERALANLGHTVLHFDTKRTGQSLAEGFVDYSSDARGGHGPVFLRLGAIEPVLNRFQPQLIVCHAGGLCFTPADAQELKSRGIVLLGVTLSDPDVFPTVSMHAGSFDYHTTNARNAVAMYHAAGITNTVWMPFGIDRDYVLADLPPAPELEADVICLGHATNARPERNEIMTRLAAEFHVRVYGRGWELPGAEVVRDERQMQAARAGRIHINFAKTRADYVNVKCGVFEAIASGGVVFTSRFEEMQHFFEYGEEIVDFDSSGDLTHKLRELLAEPDRLEAIRRAAFSRLIGEHLYEHRWHELFQTIGRDPEAGEGMVPAERAARVRETLGHDGPAPRGIVVSGFYGARNSGDELLLRSIVANLRQASSAPLEVVVAGHDPVRITSEHGLRAFPRTDLDRAAEEVEASSAVILGGGGLWHDYTFERAGGLAGWFRDPRLSVTGMGVIPLMASILRRHLHVYGLGAGPLDHPHARQVVRFLGELAQSITVRDRTSQKLLHAIEGWSADVAWAPDPVYALELEDGVVPEPIRLLRAGWRIVVVNMRPWAAMEGTGALAAIVGALERISSRGDVALVGLPMQGAEKVDPAAIERVFELVEPQGPMTMLSWDCDLREVLGTLAAADAVLAMRLHACLVAHRVHTPAVGLGYDPKVMEHFSELGLADRCLPLSAASEAIEAQLDRALALEGRTCAAARARVRELEQASVAGLRELAARLADAPPMRLPEDAREWLTGPVPAEADLAVRP